MLDEIGGIELLCPDFSVALEQLLQQDIPVVGVLKGRGPASALVEALELSEEYTHAAARLRSLLQGDENTLLYECMQFDKQALHLAEQWVKEYARE